MEISFISQSRLDNHVELLQLCFPSIGFNGDYLTWLYYANPLGDVVGFDAMDGNALVAHYACIPIRVNGKLGLLSLNTATHPKYRSKGLYQKLAQQTYEHWSSRFEFVVGVANSQSAAVFINRLGFSELGRLNLRYGLLQRPLSGTRTWTKEDVEWRINSPRQNLTKKTLKNGMIELSVKPKKFPFRIKSLISIAESETREATESTDSNRGFTVDWIDGSNPRLYLPQKLKPSPLVMIYQSLSGNDLEINSWSFPDFDVF